MIAQKPTNDLRPHELNSKIYGDSFDSALLESIKAHGVLNPLIITGDNVIVSGHRRHAVAVKIGLEMVPVFVRELTDELDVREAIIENNRQREKTTEQRAREFAELKGIEEERAAKRKKAGVKIDHVENLPQGLEIGKSRDIAASRVGMSGKTAEKAAAVVKGIDKLEDDGRQQEAEILRKELNKSVSGAFDIARSNKVITARDAKKIQGKRKGQKIIAPKAIDENNDIKMLCYFLKDLKKLFSDYNKLITRMGLADYTQTVYNDVKDNKIGRAHV